MMSTKAITSPRIDALQQQIATGNTAALDTFWDTVITEGAPLIEPIEGDRQHALVTFLWRADDAVEHVVLYSELLKGAWWNSWSDALFTHLPDTNLYYRTYRVRTDLRFVYWLTPNHPLHHIADVEDWETYLAH
ncbi:MAG: enterochelin esterase domain-containing protein [Chloroflexota bacterium]